MFPIGESLPNSELNLSYSSGWVALQYNSLISEFVYNSIIMYSLLDLRGGRKWHLLSYGVHFLRPLMQQRGGWCLSRGKCVSFFPSEASLLNRKSCSCIWLSNSWITSIVVISALRSRAHFGLVSILPVEVWNTSL